MGPGLPHGTSPWAEGPRGKRPKVCVNFDFFTASQGAGVGMRRRNFMTVVAGAAAYPLLAGAQQKPMPAIGKVEPGSRLPIVGVLLNEPPEPAFAGFHEKFRELGYEEGRNVRLEIRSADSKSERLPGLAEELVRMKVDVIISAYSPPTRAAINATKQIPIVMASVDPLVGGTSPTCRTRAEMLPGLRVSPAKPPQSGCRC
jgi:ABC transporter substrate binding protein